MEPNQHGDQNVLKISTEVHVFHHTDQTDRTLYWTVPHASGWELWLEPWPDDRFDRTRFCIHHTVFHFMKNSRDKIAFGRTNSEIGHRYSILDCTVRTARATGLELLQNSRPDDRIPRTESRLSRPVLHSKKNGRGRFQFDRMDFKLGRATSFPSSLDCHDRVLALSAGHAEAPNKHLFLVGPVRHIRQQIEIVSPTELWSKEHVNTYKGESDPRRRLLHFDVQQFCDNFVKGVDKALKDVSKSQKKSTSTRAPVAEPSFSISKKTQGESENCFEELKDFSDSSPIFDETDEELIEKLTVLQPEHPSSLVLSQQVFEEEPLDIPHQCPCLDTWISLDEVPEPIFDVEDEPDPVFDEEATSIISTFMESHLCFVSGTTTAPSSHAPLLPDLQEHCEKSELFISLPDMFDKISSLDPDLLSFENDKTWNFLRSSCETFVDLSVADILVYNTFFEKCLETLIVVSQSELKLAEKCATCSWNDILIFDLNKYLSCTFDPGILVFVLSIQERQVQPLNESIGRAQQPQIWRSFVVQTGYLGASDRGSVQEGYLNNPTVFCLESNFKRTPTHQGFTEAWNRMTSFTDEEVMNFTNQRFFSPSIREYQISKGYAGPIKKRPEPKPIIRFQMDLPASQKDRYQKEWPRDLEVMIHPPKPARPKTALPSSFSQQTRENPTKEAAKCSAHEKQLELMILHDPNVFPQSFFCLNQKHFVLKVQDIKDQFQMEASRKGRHNTCDLGTWNWKYLRETSSKLQGSKMDLRSNPFEEEANYTPRFEHRPAWVMDTSQGGDLVDQLDLTEVFSSVHVNSLIIYATLDELRPADETEDELKQSVHKLEPAEESVHELKPAKVRVDELYELSELSDITLELDELSDSNLELNELSDTEDGAGLVFPQSFFCLNQKHCKDHELIASTLHENVLKPRISKRKHILTFLKNVLLKPFHELCSLSCALKEIWFRKRHEPKLLRPKNSFDFVHDDNFSNLALSLSFHNSFSPWPDFEIDK
ncbi:hypothetical protein IGI04_023497 [Brassica rapa subsp. trilocularis]|uniref:Uncharacterized protein n=1 Tax=Brassica rapa subsp. trilocularis TaxID=1813537 RepID=A0ABQ7M422_BRACM|nr:hypothetical protein IGI04_023497 [Brassica rapa subsp. trilocularis]